MITTTNQDDQLAYSIVVHGIDAHAFERIAAHFDCRRGGIRPTDASRYVSIPLPLDALSSTFAWIKAELVGCYSELYLGVSVGAKLSWTKLIISAEIALLAGQHDAAIKVLLSR